MKSEVEEKRLGDYVLMPPNLDTSFKTWWRSLACTESVQVRYPHEQHGNARRVSNSSKSDTK